MENPPSLPTPPSEELSAGYSRPNDRQAAADAIPLLVDDTYHLFHLTTPPNTVHHPPRLRSCWSRLKSKDLVNWTRDRSPVVTPGCETGDPDISGAWTGSAVLGPDGNMNIFYTGYSLPHDGKQMILRVTSTDRHGSSFSQDKRQPINIKTRVGGPTFEDIDFRDPYVFFNESASEYWMLVATRLREGPYWTRGCVALLTSPNLEEWTMRSEPLYAPGDMFCPECPELFSLPNGKWYLVYSRFSAPNAGTVYRIADSPHGPFRTPRDGSKGRLDGRRWYAAKSCPKDDDPSKRVYFGWIADQCDDDGKWLWGGDLGVPREVSADAKGHLRIEPATEVLSLFRSTQAQAKIPSSFHLSSLGSTSIVFPEQDEGVKQRNDVIISLNIEKFDAASFGLMFDVDSELKGHQLSFTRVGEVWTVALHTDLVPLCDFWGAQYGMTNIPRGVDGPEIVHHEGVTINGPVYVFMRDRLIECFVGGRSISYRMPNSNVQPGQSPASHPCAPFERGGSVQDSKRLALFVEDGTVDLRISLEEGGVFSKCHHTAWK